MKGKGGEKMKERNDKEKNPYATNRGGRIEAPHADVEKPASNVNRPAGDGRG